MVMVDGPLPVPTSEKFVRCKAGDAVVLAWTLDFPRSDEDIAMAGGPAALRRTLDAQVLLASGNGRSLIVAFEGMLDGWLGGCAIGWHDEAECFVTVGGNSTRIVLRKGT